MAHCLYHILQYAEGAANKVKEYIRDRPANCRLSWVIQVYLHRLNCMALTWGIYFTKVINALQ
jgi:hypothetical protein